MFRRRQVILASVAAPCLAIATVDPAAEFLRRTRQRYAALMTYQDHGSVRYQIMGSDQEVAFETNFVRPDLFRFEWSKGHPFPPLRHLVTRSAIWRNAEGAFTWTRYPGEAATMRKDESLRLSVAGATGVSSGSAHTIATLLMPDLWNDEPFGRSVLDLEAPQLAGDEAIDGVAVRCVRGLQRKEPMELWIGKDDYLVRRVVTTRARFTAIEDRGGILVDAALPSSRFSAPGPRS